MRAEIAHAIGAAQSDARVLVMTGAGDAFCSGQDLASTGPIADLDFGKTLRDEYVPMIKAISDATIPTIAAVNGPAAGAGANLALAFDVVIASSNAYFIQAFTRIGLMPDAGGTYWLPRQIGAARAMGAALFADKVSAAQAADWGMIYEAIPADAFEAHWRARAAHLAQGPSQAYAHVKTALRCAQNNTLDAQLALEEVLQVQCGATEDFAEGAAAFLEKRRPVFKGR